MKNKRGGYNNNSYFLDMLIILSYVDVTKYNNTSVIEVQN